MVLCGDVPHTAVVFVSDWGKTRSDLPFGILFNAGVLFTMLESRSASKSSNLDPKHGEFLLLEISAKKTTIISLV
jgi:hypothetical protein